MRDGHVALNDVIEQVVISKNRSEQLAVVITIFGADGLAIKADLSLLWGVQPQQQLDQGGLTAAVFADDEHNVALIDLHIHRPQPKGRVAVHRRKAVANVDQLKAVDRFGLCALLAQHQVRFWRIELLGQFCNAAKSYLRPADNGQGADQVFQRTFHVQQHQYETADYAGVGAGPKRLHGQRQANHHEKQHRTQAFGDDKGVD